MPNSFVVDTHALIWFLQDDQERLGKGADPASGIIVPAIVLAEISHLIIRGRTSITCYADLINAIDSDPRIHVAAIDRETVRIAHSLTGIRELHDRLIAATVIQTSRQGEEAVLITCDNEIRLSGQVAVIR